MRRIFRISLLAFGMAIFVYIGASVAFLVHFPSQIQLTEYNTHELPMFHGWPFNASFRNETTAVFKVSDSPLTVETEEPGTAEMTIDVFGIQLRHAILDILPDGDIVPVGMAVGVHLETYGVRVLNVGSFKDDSGMEQSPAKGKLEQGDLILAANGKSLYNKEDFLTIVAEADGDIEFCIQRDNKEMSVTVTPVHLNNVGNSIGVHVRNPVSGIGTLTYYNPSTGEFGGLGHGIHDLDTEELVSLKDGWIMPSTIFSVKKGLKGTPGELDGDVDKKTIVGLVTANTESGIRGQLFPGFMAELSMDSAKIATQSLVRKGPATILTNASSSQVNEYDIIVEDVNRLITDKTKGMTIRIIDPELLEMTNGIVQGMSGSPILQDGRLIGAVTHVFVQDPTKGYAGFIENMLGD